MKASPSKRIALVVQRYGTDIAGGAESFARMYAKYLNKFCEVTVLTTQAKDYHTWENQYPEGEQLLEGIKVHRFKSAKKRDFDAFCQTSFYREIASHTMTATQEEEYFIEQGPYCPDLVRYIEDHQDDYHNFVFFTYLYYTTVAGMRAVAKKSFIAPTSHNEPPFYFARSLSPLFANAKGLIYLSEGERKIIESTYPCRADMIKLPGMIAVEAPPQLSPQREAELRKKYQKLLSQMYFIYVGRASITKNCQTIVPMFSMGRHLTGAQAHLAFCGTCDFELPKDREDIFELGFVSEEEKHFLIKNAIALINPSAYESLSIVCLEALINKTAIIVNGACDATKDLAINSKGGVYFNSDAMYIGLFEWAMRQPELLVDLGRQGELYVKTHFNWDQTVKETLRHLIH